MTDDAALWRRTSRALDRVFELDGAARAAALAELDRDDPPVGREVRALLAADPGTDLRLERAAAAVAEVTIDGRPGDRTLAGDRIGDWRILSPLGAGGMGEVFLAERVGGGFEQQAALKLLRRGLDSERVVARFVRERQILARLEHPGIARLLDGGVAPDGRPYFVLELVEGEPITEWTAARALGVRARLRLFLDVCAAVEAAHHSLIVHRDLKPSNVLVDHSGHPRLLDFGIAKLVEPGADEGLATRLGPVPLTPAYAAPEQILGGPITMATDVWALGALLHELLTGERPHAREARTPAELVVAVERERLATPSERLRRRARSFEAPLRRARLESSARALRGDLDAVLATALAAEPDRRYPTVAALADDLRRHLEGQPVAARGEAFGYRAGKFVSRHRLALGAGLVIAASVAGGLGIALGQAQRARAEAARAEATRAFLVELFANADPNQARGEQVTARELLDQGARQLSAGVGADPRARAALAETLARAYLGLGVLDAAERFAATALAEARGLDAERLGRALWVSGRIAAARGDAVLARARLDAAVERLTAALGDDAPVTLAARADLARVGLAPAAPAAVGSPR